MAREDSPLSVNGWEHQHGPEGNSHLCIFCGRVYGCATIHATWNSDTEYGEKMSAGGRCCAACRRENVAALDRLEEVRRRSLYVG